MITYVYDNKTLIVIKQQNNPKASLQ